MGNLVHAELYLAARHRVAMGALLLVCLALPPLVLWSIAWGVRYGSDVYSAQTAAETAVFSLCQGMSLGPFLALPIAVVVFSDQYRCGTLKNEVVFGISRWKCVVSRLLAGILLGLGAAALVMISFLLSCLALLPDPGCLFSAMERFAPVMLSAVPLWVSSGAIALGLLFFFRNSGVAATLYLVYFTVGFVSIALLYIISMNSTGFIWTVSRLLADTHPYNMMWSSMMEVSSAGFSFRWEMVDAAGSKTVGNLLLGIGWTAAGTGLGVLGLYRKELR